MKYPSMVATFISLLLNTASAATAAEAQARAPADNNTEDRISILYDAFGDDPGLTKDWGFSALIEINGKRILFDTGNDDAIFMRNVAATHADLANLDFVVISHRHGDHTGGLSYLLSVNPAVPIYVPKENFGVFGGSLPGTFLRPDEALPANMRYFDGSPPATLLSGTPWGNGNFTSVAESQEIAPGFHLILLHGSWGVDLDVMELSLAIETPNGIVLVVGCSHPTIEKIVAAAAALSAQPIRLLIGGLHLLPASNADVHRIAKALRGHWKVAWIAPDHCTGEYAFEVLQRTFGEHYLYAGLGRTLSLSATQISSPTGPALRAAYPVRTYEP